MKRRQFLTENQGSVHDAFCYGQHVRNVIYFKNEGFTAHFYRKTNGLCNIDIMSKLYQPKQHDRSMALQPSVLL